MSRKKKSELAFEIVQRTNCKANQNFAVANNPENDEKKLRLCNLISEEDCIKFSNTLSERGLLEKSCFRVHSGDMRKNKDTGEIETEMEHIHMALLFRTAQTYQSVSELFQEITGKVVPPSCVCSCTYADITSSRPSDEEQYSLMVTYQTHAGKDGACTPEIANFIENNKIPYKLVHNIHSMQWIDKETGETKEEVEDRLYFMPEPKPAPLNAEEVAFFTGDTSKLHQNLYNPDTLNTFNTDVLECFKIRQKISEHESEKAEARELQKKAMQVLIDIREGKIPEYNYELVVEPAVDAIMKNGQVANAYNYYYNRIKAEMKAKGFLNIPARNIFFIEGNAGTGKSTLAQLLCENAKDKDGNPKPLSYYVVSTGAHGFDDYMGQEVIILDDCRDSTYRLNELLKILDNNTHCDVQARYHNKNLCAVKYIIITSAKPLISWYREGQDKGEQMRQLWRRIRVHFTLSTLPDGTHVCQEDVWDKKIKDYVTKSVEYYSNPDDVFEEQEEAEDIGEIAMDLMRGGMDALGVKHWSASVAQPAFASPTSPDAQPQNSSVLPEPVNNSLPVPNSQAGHSAQSEWTNITPELNQKDNRPEYYFDNEGRRFRLADDYEAKAKYGVQGHDYVIDNYGVVYVFDGWTDGESLNTIDEQIPFVDRMVWSEEENRYRLA